MNDQINEALLDAWLGMSVSVRGNRIVSGMRFNEILICNILYRQKEAGLPNLTATDLCDRTRLLKSQINKLLSALEEKEIIERSRSSQDKRRVYLCLKEENISVYLKEHEQILKILDKLIRTMGEEKIVLLTSLLTEATNVITE